MSNKMKIGSPPLILIIILTIFYLLLGISFPNKIKIFIMHNLLSIYLETIYLTFCWKVFTKRVLKYTYIFKKIEKVRKCKESEVLKSYI